MSEQPPENKTSNTSILYSPELQSQFANEYGIEALEYRLLYEEAIRQLNVIYAYAEENGIELPNPGSGYQ